MIDFITDENGELTIQDGDFAIGDSGLQHQKYLLLAGKGTYKQYPTTGVGIMDFLNSDSPAELMREVRLQFSQDGMTVERLGILNGKIEVDAHYGG